ncbi:DUF3011 domain-containing protein [Polycladidibacter hongkongensis]|uniref:DUF3011 domain-containing protein n=1 Tax=Polycladidibacter hongkongensis TaxID=1647556 RepID=UPI000831C299|nr:DUF3011 domain-containing protein [Pseudovibrio hongkongensis]
MDTAPARFSRQLSHVLAKFVGYATLALSCSALAVAQDNNQTTDRQELLGQLIPSIIFQKCHEQLNAPINSPQFIACLQRATGAKPSPVEHQGNADYQPESVAPGHLPQVLAHPPAEGYFPDELLSCAAPTFGRRLCKLPYLQARKVAFLRQTARKPCVLDQTWGLAAQGIWVKDGCAALFYVSKPESPLITAQIAPRRFVDRPIEGLTSPVPSLPRQLPGGWVQCALEHQPCAVPHPTVVRFGRPGAFVERFVDKEVACTKSRFRDPARGAPKACYYRPQAGSQLQTQGIQKVEVPPLAAPQVVATPTKKLWHIRGGDPVHLEHGVPETDERDFLASCKPASGLARVTLAPFGSHQPGSPLNITAWFDGHSRPLHAIASSGHNESGSPEPQLILSLTDMFWDNLQHKNSLVLQHQNGNAYTVSLKGSAAALRKFKKLCKRSS